MARFSTSHLYDLVPDVVRAKRLRSSAGGLVILGLADLTIRQSDREPSNKHLERSPSIVEELLREAVETGLTPFDKLIDRLLVAQLDRDDASLGTGPQME